jgi:hypothetical protein
MATEFMSHHKSGVIAGESHYFRADGTNTPLWAPVILATKTTGDYLPEVATTSTLSDPTVIGVTVGPIADSANSYCNIAAGEMIEVCTHGICKLKVDGTDPIALGDALCTHAAAGYAQLLAVNAATTYLKATFDTLFKYIGAAFAKALEASSADADIIPVFVYGGMGTVT